MKLCKWGLASHETQLYHFEKWQQIIWILLHILSRMFNCTLTKSSKASSIHCPSLNSFSCTSIPCRQILNTQVNKKLYFLWSYASKEEHHVKHNSTSSRNDNRSFEHHFRSFLRCLIVHLVSHQRLHRSIDQTWIPSPASIPCRQILNTPLK